MLPKVMINLLMMCLLFTDTEYQILFSAMKKTCRSKYKIERISNMDETRCKKNCNENNKCNFVFSSIINTCILYTSCDETREPTIEVGTTYGKTILNGILFTVNKLQLLLLHNTKDLTYPTYQIS